MTVSDLINLASQIEGPYKWYVISGVVVVLTALLTRFIFKTLKWFFIIAALALLVLTLVNYLERLGIIERGVSLFENAEQETE